MEQRPSSASEPLDLASETFDLIGKALLSTFRDLGAATFLLGALAFLLGQLAFVRGPPLSGHAGLEPGHEPRAVFGLKKRSFCPSRSRCRPKTWLGSRPSIGSMGE